MNKFRTEQHSTADKSFKIIPPTSMDIDITIDYDDVDHTTVNKNARRIVDVMNDSIAHSNGLCSDCGDRLVLMSGSIRLEPNDEPYESGKKEELDIEVDTFITTHFCQKCKKVYPLDTT